MNKSAVFFVQLFSKRFSRLRSSPGFFRARGQISRPREGRKGEEASLSRVPLARGPLSAELQLHGSFVYILL